VKDCLWFSVRWGARSPRDSCVGIGSAEVRSMLLHLSPQASDATTVTPKLSLTRVGDSCCQPVISQPKAAAIHYASVADSDIGMRYVVDGMMGDEAG
jgi:hypothetical protein